ncbi:MAG: alpha-ketoglutarate-dependent dioxygenase AlkB [Methylococcales bacterium]
MQACSELEIIENFYAGAESEQLYQRLQNEQDWPDNHYAVAGRLFTLPRLQTWHADAGIRYSYSNNLLQTRTWTPLLSDIRHKIEDYLSFSFNSVLVNWYRNGADYVGWHADNEPELGKHPVIASLSLGATRAFAVRHKHSLQTRQLDLRSGTLLIMHPDFQQHWLHSLPAVKTLTQGRINLTFRKVITSL